MPATLIGRRATTSRATPRRPSTGAARWNQQTEGVLLRNIQEVADEPVSLTSEDPRCEVAANTTWFGAPPEERSSLSVDQVVTAFEKTARTLRRRVVSADVRGTATFYVWHDEQAGQLRCSVSSRTPANLPFDATYRPTNDLGVVVASFLSDQTAGLVPWDDLDPADDPETGENSTYPPFLVWTYDLTPDR